MRSLTRARRRRSSGRMRRTPVPKDNPRRRDTSTAGSRAATSTVLHEVILLRGAATSGAPTNCEIGGDAEVDPRPGPIPTIYAIVAAGIIPIRNTGVSRGQRVPESPEHIDAPRTRPERDERHGLPHSHILTEQRAGWFHTVNIRVFDLDAWNAIAAAKTLAKVRSSKATPRPAGRASSAQTPDEYLFLSPPGSGRFPAMMRRSGYRSRRVRRKKAGRQVIAKDCRAECGDPGVQLLAAYRPQLIEKTDHEPHTDIFAVRSGRAPERGLFLRHLHCRGRYPQHGPPSRASISPMSAAPLRLATTGQASTNASGCCDGYMRCTHESAAASPKIEPSQSDHCTSAGDLLTIRLSNSKRHLPRGASLPRLARLSGFVVKRDWKRPQRKGKPYANRKASGTGRHRPSARVSDHTAFQGRNRESSGQPSGTTTRRRISSAGPSIAPQIQLAASPAH